ncbi:MAG: hypothetical protein GY913_24500 [Proteobacteria bacterium]|nr:hypothetical protein [Pseudomonadota bacterium]MCP4920075.1 hypothetical protein [Pseudomonadota bacterium]
MSLMNSLPIGLGALVVGGGLGYGLATLLMDPVEKIVTEPLIIKQELTEEELLAFCDDQIEPERQKVEDAHSKVLELQAKLDAREAELTTMKAQDEKDEARRAVASKKWKEMEAEIETLKLDLDSAIEDRDEAMSALKTTVIALEKQIKETEKQKQRAEHFREESQVNLWTTFVAESKVSICGWGTPGRLDKCQGAVDEALAGDFKDRFMECVDSYQSTPILHQQEDRKATLPLYAEPLNEDSRFTKRGWYIQFCDPTLPEAEGFDD